MKFVIDSLYYVIATLFITALAFIAFTEPVSYPEAVVKHVIGKDIVDIQGHLFEITLPW